jgi:hypothetical protein
MESIGGFDWQTWEPLLILAAIGIGLETIRERLSRVDLRLTHLIEGHLIDGNAERWQATPLRRGADGIFSVAHSPRSRRAWS